MIVGLITAAGKSKRFGSPKALAFIHPLLSVYSASKVDDTLVTWPRDLPHPNHPSTTFIRNKLDEFGLSGSILSAWDVFPKSNAIIVNPIDAPFTTPKLLNELIQAHLTHPNAFFIVPRCQSKKKNGHPVLVKASILHELREVGDKGGLKALMNLYPNTIHTVDSDENCLANLNYPANPSLRTGMAAATDEPGSKLA